MLRARYNAVGKNRHRDGFHVVGQNIVAAFDGGFGLRRTHQPQRAARDASGGSSRNLVLRLQCAQYSP